MAKTFAILSILITLFAGFVAYKNQELYIAEIATRQEREATNRNLNENLTRLKGEVTKNKETLASEQQTLSSKKEEVADKTKKNNELAAEVTTKKADVAAREAQVAEAEKALGNRDELRDMITKLKSQRAELETLKTEIATNESSLNNLNSEQKRLDGVIAELREVTSWPVRKISNPKLRTTVKAVYPTWGFVTLSAGEDSGVIAGSILEVKREDATVARLLVTAVESGTAAADIVPEGMAGQPVVNPGDLVVAAPPAKEDGVLRSDKPAPAAGATGTPAQSGAEAPLPGAEPAAPGNTPAKPVDDPFADFATPAK